MGLNPFPLQGLPIRLPYEKIVTPLIRHSANPNPILRVLFVISIFIIIGF
jgi:hypothetical protein